MGAVLINVGIVAVLIVLEAVFVAAEISLVSLRESQVKALAERGARGRRVAHLVADPNRFLGAVQLGVTLTAILSSAFGAEKLTEPSQRQLERTGLGSTPAYVLAFLGIAVIIAFVTIVIGELVPKRLALQRAEGAAQLFAPVLDRIASIVRPVIWALSHSTDVVVRLLGGDPGADREQISDEELRGLVASHESLSGEERHLIDEVFAAAERLIREVMVPRTEVTFIDGSATVAAALRETRALPHSRYPVEGESQDDILGFVHIRDLVGVANDRGRVLDVTRDIARLPESKNVLAALSEMRRGGQHMAVVVDEYGGTAGIVTLEDLIEEVIGDIRDEYDEGERASDARLLRGGGIEVDGLLNMSDFTHETGVTLPEGPYETAAGFVVAQLGHLPRVGEAIEVVPPDDDDDDDDGDDDEDDDEDDAGVPTVVTLTVAALDGRRVARLKVTVAERRPAAPR